MCSGDLTMPSEQEWVLLAYRLPREPSTPRSQVWRKLKRLGVVQIADGLVALPAEPRTREALEWIAEEVTDNDGDAMLWIGHPTERSGQHTLRERMTETIAAEYAAITAEARSHDGADPITRRRSAQRLRRELQRVQSRDFYSPPERDAAVRAADELASTASPVPR